MFGKIIVSLGVFVFLNSNQFSSNMAMPNVVAEVISKGTLKKNREESKKRTKDVKRNVIDGIFSHNLENSESSELRKNLHSYRRETHPDVELDIKGASDKGAVMRSQGKNGSKVKCNEEQCEVGSIFSSRAMVDRDIKMEESGFKKGTDGEVIDNKGYLDKARKVIKEAKDKFDFIRGEYKDCQSKETSSISTREESCDEYYDIAHNTCSINQVVEIDPKYTYQCSKKREVKEKVCVETIVSACDKISDCGFNAGGIVQGTVDTGIEWDYAYPYLRLGSTTGSWHFSCGGWTCCKKVEMTARFRIQGLSTVKNFSLHKVSYEGYAMVFLNGHQVHNTLGGYKLEITNRRGRERPQEGDLLVDGGNGKTGECWRLYPNNGKNHYDIINRDLKSYLKEGWNDVKMVLVYAELGQFNVVFNAEQYCCNSWNNKAERKCEYIN